MVEKTGNVGLYSWLTCRRRRLELWRGCRRDARRAVLPAVLLMEIDYVGFKAFGLPYVPDRIVSLFHFMTAMCGFGGGAPKNLLLRAYAI